jgi:hypothetical protein
MKFNLMAGRMLALPGCLSFQEGGFEMLDQTLIARFVVRSASNYFESISARKAVSYRYLVLITSFKSESNRFD